MELALTEIQVRNQVMDTEIIYVSLSIVLKPEDVLA